MAPTYPDAVRVVAKLGEVMFDLTNFVVTDIEIKDGFSGTTPIDRVADVGRCEFELDNTEGLFNALGAFAPSALLLDENLVDYLLWEPDEDRLILDAPPVLQLRSKVWVDVLWQGRWWNMFTGRIDSLKPSGPPYFGAQRVAVVLVDFMDDASRHVIKLAETLANQRIDQAMDVLVDAMPVQPENRQFSQGNTVFPTVFDDIGKSTRASSEFAKLALSEPGYVYMRQGDTLVVENSTDNNGQSQLDTIGYADGFLMDEEGNYLLWQPPAGGAGRLILDVEESAVLSQIQDDELQHGKQLINSIQMRTYPRSVGASREILFKMGQPMRLPPYSTVIFRGEFRDPTGGDRIAGADPDTITATTDYLANTARNGSGSNITANISVSVEWFSDGFEATITTAASGGWLTKFEPRAYAVRKYDVAEAVLASQASITSYGEAPLVWDMAYRSSPTDERAIAGGILGMLSHPITENTAIEILANVSKQNMAAALQLGINSLITIQRGEERTLNFITSRKITIALIGIITVAFSTRQMPTMEPVALRMDGADVSLNTSRYRLESVPLVGSLFFFIDIGDLSVADNVIFPLVNIRNGENVINTHVGVGVYRQSGGSFVFVVDLHAYDGDYGRWVPLAAIPPDFGPVLVAVSFDLNNVNNDPVVKVNSNTPVALSQVQAQTGSLRPINAPTLHIGSFRGVTTSASMQGYLQYVGLMNVPFDLDTFANQDPGTILFLGPAVPKENASIFFGQEISTSYNPIDAISLLGMEEFPTGVDLPIIVPLRGN